MVPLNGGGPHPLKIMTSHPLPRPKEGGHVIGHSNPDLGREIGQEIGEIEIGEANEVEIETTDAMMTDRKHLTHALENFLIV